MGYNCLKATKPLQGGSLLFTTKLSKIRGTQLIDLGRMKAESTLESATGFEHAAPGRDKKRNLSPVRDKKSK